MSTDPDTSPRITKIGVNNGPLNLTGKKTGTATLERPEVDDQMRRTWHDDQEATEKGACAVAIVLIQEMEGLVRPSRY